MLEKIRALLRRIPSRSVVMLIIVFAVAWFLNRDHRPGGYDEREPVSSINQTEMVVDTKCDPTRNPCNAFADSLVAAVRLGPKVKTMKQFPLSVVLSGEGYQKVKKIIVEFNMQGMNMGQNRYALIQTEPDRWTGTALLPFCSSGRTDWQMTLELLSEDLRSKAVFDFTVE